MTGAKIGAIPFTNIKIEKNRVNAGPLHTSLAIARAITIPAPPENPWINRNTRKTEIDDTQAHIIVETVKINIPAVNGPFRPFPSLAGPAKICPTAMPAMEAVNVI